MLTSVSVITIEAKAGQNILFTVTKKNAIPVAASFRGIVLPTIPTMMPFVAGARRTWKMTEDEIVLNSNIRRKLARQEKKWTGQCLCGGMPKYQLKRCFRPGGAACVRRAMRRHRKTREA